MKIAVVGGAGKMGQWIARFLVAEGVEVTLIDSNPERVAAAGLQLRAEASTNLGAVETADVVVLAVPITAFEPIVKELSRFVKKGQFVVDVTSVKVMPVDVMHRFLPGCTVLGAHPVFGPGAAGLEGHNIVLTPTNDDERCIAEQAKTFLEQRQACVKLMTPAGHDQLMAVVLGLAHYIAIVSGDTLLALDNLADMELVSGVTFRVLMTLVASVLSEDPALYASIQTHLPELPLIEHDFANRASQWAQMVQKKDSAEITRRLTMLRDKLGKIAPDSDRAYRDMYHIAEGH